MNINGVLNGHYKTASAKLDIKAKELAIAVWRTRHIWMYVILIPALPASYFTMHHFFLGVMEQGLWLSNLTANFFVLIVAWLWYNQDIATALWRKIQRKLHSKEYNNLVELVEKTTGIIKAPFWFQMCTMLLMVFGLMTYLSFWGYETIW